MEYKFYVQMDGDTFGPYSAKEILALDLMDDILVTEESMNGTWLPARRFDFQDMYMKESGTVINDDGSISRSVVPEPIEVQSSHHTTDSTYTYSPDQGELSKWNWGAFWFNWLWGVFNGVYWPLIAILLSAIPYIGPFIGIGVSIYLGVEGTRLAWNAKSWPSWESFQKTQSNWAKAVLWVVGISLVLVLIGVIASDY